MHYRFAGLLPVASLAILAASCSLLFDDSGRQPAGDGGVDDGTPSPADAALDGGIPALPFSDTFEERDLGPRWGLSTNADPMDECHPSEIEKFTGQRSLECNTNTGLGGRAAVYLDVPPTDNLRVEMDVFFDSALPVATYLAFLQTFHVSGISPRVLTSLDLKEQAGGDLLEFWNKEPVVTVNGLDPVPGRVWVHVDFEVYLDEVEGSISVTTVAGNLERSGVDTLNQNKELITRVEIGLSELASSISVPQKIFIDNFQVTSERE